MHIKMSEAVTDDGATIFSESWNQIQTINSKIKSRYGRIHKPKVSDDFINYDPEFESKEMLEEKEPSPNNTSLQIAPVNNYNGKCYTKPVHEIVHVTANTIIEEFDDDFDSPIASHKRKFFKTSNKHFKTQYIHDNYLKKNYAKFKNGNKEDAQVNMDDVLKIITNKTVCNFESKSPTKKPLKTYSKKKDSTENYVLETFGLPDDPSLPFLTHHENIEKTEEFDLPNDSNKNLINSWDTFMDNEFDVDNKLEIDISKLEQCNNHDVTKEIVQKEKSNGQINNGENSRIDIVIKQEENDTNKVDNVLEACNTNEIHDSLKEEKSQFNVGDLAWARLTGMPFWPCLCTEDPITNMHIKIIGRAGSFRRHFRYHVRFFGDNGRRAWVPAGSMLRFQGKNDLDLQKPNLSKANSSGCNISPHYHKQWQIAVEETLLVLNKSNRERQEFFSNILMKKAKIKKVKPKLEKNIETINNNVVEIEKQPKHTESKRRKKRKASESAIKNMKNYILSSRRKLRRSNRKPITKKENNNTYIISTRPSRKSSVNSPNNNLHKSVEEITLEQQEILFKRNNLFKRVTRQKVCEICTKGKNVLKCQECLGNFHFMCQEEAFKKVQIIYIKSKRSEEYSIEISSDLEELNLAEKIDVKLKEIMCRKRIIYADSTTDTSSCDNMDNETNLFKCYYCASGTDPPCSICWQYVSKKKSKILQKCSKYRCSKVYHPECLKSWPQTQWCFTNPTRHKDTNEYLDTFVCPEHSCHTCLVDDPCERHTYKLRMAHCIKCPGSYHATNYCLPAGTQILSSTQIICPRHVNEKKKSSIINVNWCFLCSKGGNLICCETCPTCVHSECMHVNIKDEDTFLCENCENGRFPLYDEVVWAKLGTYRWWPAIIIFPKDIPERVLHHAHQKDDFVVKFFGTNDYNWIGKGRVFLFEEGDNMESFTAKTKMDTDYLRALEQANINYKIKKEFKSSKRVLFKENAKPPPYGRIKFNKPYGNVRPSDTNISNTTACDCDPKDDYPCGPDSDCLNRLLLTECNPEVCPAGENCNNQRFEKRLYPPLVPYKTETKGWGLKCLEPLMKGQFVIEYVGEVIDEQEYYRRIKKMSEKNNDNYYFLTIDKDRIIDAGPKGNLSRFMNHSCQPNCETQKWTVNGDTRVGLFAIDDVKANEELTFNYNLECVGKEKKVCMCSAPNCKGYIGQTPKQEERQKKIKKKKIVSTPQVPVINNEPCFVCGKCDNVVACQNKICNKYYHLKCVNLESWPEGRWVCPWHNCKICTKRTIRCCLKCINSYCPSHAYGNISYNKTLLGFVCSEHDPSKATQEELVTSTTEEEIESSTSKRKESEINQGLSNGYIVNKRNQKKIDKSSNKRTLSRSKKEPKNVKSSMDLHRTKRAKIVKQLDNEITLSSTVNR